MSEHSDSNDPRDVDFFSDSLLSLFDEFVPCHGNPSSTYTYSSPPQAIYNASFQIKIPSQDAGNSLMAHYVWQASVRMADLIASGKIPVKGKRVVELGAGAGLPSLIAAKAGAQEVCITDYNDVALVNNLAKNIEMAKCDKQHVLAVGYTWGSPLPPELANPFDVILLSDTLWVSAQHESLINSVINLLSPNGRVYVIAGTHSGRAPVYSFIKRAEKLGLVTRSLSSEEPMPVSSASKASSMFWREVDFQGNYGVEFKEEDTDGDEEPISKRNRWVVEGCLSYS